MSDVIQWPSGTKKGFMDATDGDGVVIERPWAARGTVQSQISPTLTTSRGGVQEYVSLRRRNAE